MDIFISYRRVGGREIARTVCLALQKEGYSDVFFDFNSLRDGIFNEQICKNIEECKDFILVLTEGALNRCGIEGDWVAKEISLAIEAGCKNIPLVVDANHYEWPESLPKKFNILKSIQFTTLLTNEYFDDSIRHLIERLDSKPKVLSSNATQEDASVFHFKISSDETCDLFIDNERICKIKARKTADIKILKRETTYKITLLSLANKKDEITEMYTVPKFSNEYTYNVSFDEYRSHILEKKRKEAEEKRKQKELNRSRKENLKEQKKRYKFVDDCYEDMTAVGKPIDGPKQMKYGFIDSQGLEIIPCIFDDVSHYSEGLCGVCEDGVWSYYDKEGCEILSQVSEVPGYFTNGVVPVVKYGRYGLIDKTGKELIPAECDFITYPNKHFIAVKRNGKFHIYDLGGQPAINQGFDSIVDMIETREYCQKGGVIVEPIYSDVAHRHSCSFLPEQFRVKKNNRIGMVSKDGVLIIKCTMEELEPIEYPHTYHFSGQPSLTTWYELLRFKQNGKNGIISGTTGIVSVPAKYDFILRFGNYYIVANNGHRIEANDYGLWQQYQYESNNYGLINDKGVVVIPMDYKYIACGFWGWMAFKQLEPNCRNQFFAEYFESSYWLNRPHKESPWSDEKPIRTPITMDEYCIKDNGDFVLSRTVHWDSNKYEITDVEPQVKAEETEEFHYQNVAEYEISHPREYCNWHQIEWPTNYSIDCFDKVEPMEIPRYSIVYKDHHCGLYDNSTNKMLTPIEYNVIKVSEFEKDENPCQFNISTDLERGTIWIYQRDDGTLWIEDSLVHKK